MTRPHVTNCRHVTEVRPCHAVFMAFYLIKADFDPLISHLNVFETHSPRSFLSSLRFLSCFYKRQSVALLHLSWLCPRMCLSFFTASCLQTLDTLTSVEGTREALWSFHGELGRAMSPRLQNGWRKREKKERQGPLREIIFSSPPWVCRRVTTSKASVTPAVQVTVKCGR